MQSCVPAYHGSSAGLADLIGSARQSLPHDPALALTYLDRVASLIDLEDTTDRHDLLIPASCSPADNLPLKGGLTPAQLSRIRRHVEARLDETLPVHELAAVARLSAGHFCRAFKATMDETPHAFVVRQRVRRAQRLMLDTHDTLSVIACACGLTDQAHLTRLFRRFLGETPLAWRRRWQMDGMPFRKVA